MKLFSTSLGKPTNETLTLSLQTFYGVPLLLPIKHYSHDKAGYIKELVEEKMKESEKFRKKYKSFGNVLETVYQGIF